ncbi:MAG: hypothetical protein JKY37_24520 [Nannocystaceae bacterium]|nr:hypothetical protein [Nannocystaceae bacterium]
MRQSRRVGPKRRHTQAVELIIRTLRPVPRGGAEFLFLLLAARPAHRAPRLADRVLDRLFDDWPNHAQRIERGLARILDVVSANTAAAVLVVRPIGRLLQRLVIGHLDEIDHALVGDIGPPLVGEVTFERAIVGAPAALFLQDPLDLDELVLGEKGNGRQHSCLLGGLDPCHL